jgi:hypothetical protein
VVKNLISAWEALPGGRNYGPGEVERWLREHMKPAIDAARQVVLDTRSEPFIAMEGVPVSDYFRTGFCGACDNIHVVLFDECDKPLAQATFTRKHVEIMLEDFDKTVKERR